MAVAGRYLRQGLISHSKLIMSATAKQGFGSTFKRLHRETNLYKNMSSVLTKLNGEESLQRFYSSVGQIFNSEVNFTFNCKQE